MRHAVAALALIAATAAPAAPATDWRAKAVAILEHSVDVPTVAGRGRTVELANYYADQLRAGGFPASDIHVLPYTAAVGNDTADLIVRWPAENPTRKPLLLMGHMDVVEAKPEDWATTDPFKFVEKDGYYYGRGVLDMKGGDAALVATLLRLRAEGFTPKRDIVLLVTGDEETTGIGAKLAATQYRQLTDAEFGLNADGGGGRVDAQGRSLGFSLQTAEKTYADYEFAVTNKGGHSSKPRPDNAIYQLAHALTRLEAYRFQPSLNETTRAYFAERAKQEKGALGQAMKAWLADAGDGKAADAIEADPQEVGLTRTRCVATRLAGGHANNALPQRATATVNCRILPGVSPDAIRDELQRIAGDPQVKVTRLDAYPASLSSPLRGDVVAAYTAAVHRRHPGAAIIPEMSTGASDARPFRIAGVPVYGVSGAWIVSPEDERAHGRDERLPVKSFDDDLGHWHDMVTTLAG
ncbi:M20/M25/M40 family metallo-hydrolase [Sphingomonas sp.]|uniref:M20/M25/M40 family metallo-hydrolase n=1 Tax=Sphingomonas sp. TaxID=28214 RepID=UPI003B00DB5C